MVADLHPHERGHFGRLKIDLFNLPDLHALGLGFVFSMVFGHAPIVVPAVLRVDVGYRRAFYVPLATLAAIWAALGVVVLYACVSDDPNIATGEVDAAPQTRGGLEETCYPNGTCTVPPGGTGVQFDGMLTEASTGFVPKTAKG